MKTIYYLYIVLLLLIIPGCLVSNDEYEEVKKERDELKIKYEQLQEKNDKLNDEIKYIYGNIENLNKEYVLNEAFDIYQKSTESVLALNKIANKDKLKKNRR